MKPIYFYEVYHPGPCGDSPIGFFRKLSDAKVCKAEWDSKHTYSMDHAIISRKYKLL